jgi:hypothetical protein
MQAQEPKPPATKGDLQDLIIETFEIEELSELDFSTAKIEVSLCSSTCSASCG